MKHCFIIAAMAFFSVLFVGCTADYQEDYDAKQKKANVVKAEILDMARDYGLKIQLTGDITAENVDKIDMAHVEAIFKGFAGIKGKYLFRTEKKGNKMVSKQIQKTRRKRTVEKQNEQYSYYSCGFEDEDNNPYYEFFKDGYVFECSCNASWYATKAGNIANFVLLPYIRIKEKFPYNYWTDNLIYTWHPMGGEAVSFDGSIIVFIQAYMDGFPIGMKVEFSGMCDSVDGTIDWHPAYY